MQILTQGYRGPQIAGPSPLGRPLSGVDGNPLAVMLKPAFRKASTLGFPLTVSTQPPAYIAYTVRKPKQEGKKDAWVAIGAAWFHSDEKGMEILLDALPLDGRVVLRVNDRREEDAVPPVRTSHSKRQPATTDRSTGKRWPR